ncbi:hypothetical protein KY362_06060 [Candidatus Woesearchaeota archaeon]|nr:hypothetical protein [Candidatus Woesearchaeota archaeon]
MDVIRNPGDSVIKETTKSALIGRKPREEGAKFKTAVISLFNVNNPHKTTEFPVKTYEFSDMEKVRIRRLNVSYYLEGNDIVINDLKALTIERSDNKLQVKGEQEEVESREGA